YLGGLTVVLRNRGVAAGTVINRAVSGYSMMITARMPPSRCTADGSRHPGGGRDLGRSNRASNRTLARSGFPQCRRW
ncbi:hypothetical protein, partial [Kitasatospora sp. NPDC047058]|uniref:hypothetical protein n=1 Tax=Kitasatospora sp. NPDC047058 TaxID=3155620 RepID=UPI0033D385BC